MSLEEMKARVSEIVAEHSKLEKEKDELSHRIAEIESVFKVGDHIQWKIGKGMRHGIITRVLPGFMDSPEYVVAPIKSNGQQGVATKLSWYVKASFYEVAV